MDKGWERQGEPSDSDADLMPVKRQAEETRRGNESLSLRRGSKQVST